jgi:hypothetical protein
MFFMGVDLFLQCCEVACEKIAGPLSMLCRDLLQLRGQVFLTRTMIGIHVDSSLEQFFAYSPEHIHRAWKRDSVAPHLVPGGVTALNALLPPVGETLEPAALKGRQAADDVFSLVLTLHQDRLLVVHAV